MELRTFALYCYLHLLQAASCKQLRPEIRCGPLSPCTALIVWLHIATICFFTRRATAASHGRKSELKTVTNAWGVHWDCACSWLRRRQGREVGLARRYHRGLTLRDAHPQSSHQMSQLFLERPCVRALYCSCAHMFMKDGRAFATMTCSCSSDRAHASIAQW